MQEELMSTFEDSRVAFMMAVALYYKPLWIHRTDVNGRVKTVPSHIFVMYSAFRHGNEW